MSIVNSAIWFERILKLGQEVRDIAERQSERLAMIELALGARSYPPSAEGRAFRLDSTNNHFAVFNVSNPESQQWLSVKTVAHDPNGAQGIIYLRTGRQIRVGAAGTLPISGEWEWVGQTGELAPAFNRQTSTSPIVVYSTVDCDGVLYLAPQKAGIPSG